MWGADGYGVRMERHPSDLVIYGVGQLGQLFAGGALRLGLRVTPIVRATDRALVFRDLPRGTPIFLTVSEDMLPAAVDDVPPDRHGDVVLVQNELFPRRWHALGLDAPTVLVVWLSKKKGRPVEVARPTFAWGRHAQLAVEMHRALDVPAQVLDDEAALHQELVSKFAFILTINALGLAENLPLGAWLEKDRRRVMSLVDEARLLAEAHLGTSVDAEYVELAVLEAMAALKDYPARGRTAHERIERALRDAAAFGLELPRLVETQA